MLENLDVYQDRALRFWLPRAAQEPHGTAFNAAYKLAELLEQHDSDSWLRELLTAVKPNDAPAIEALSAAIRANRKGLYGLAVERSRLAADLFSKHGNGPGELRAQFETIYASQRFLEGFDCLTRIASLQTPDRYRWLRIQLALEEYTCSNFEGEFTAIEQGLEKNFRNAEESHFHLLALRALALSASIKRQQQSECHESWRQAVRGLGLYGTSGPYPPERLYEFYSILEQCAAQMKLWHAAEALQRHSIAIMESIGQDDDPNLIVAGSAHAELAAILTAEYKDADAGTEQNAADSLWRQAGSERSADTYRLFMKVRLAEIQLKRGDFLRALATLNSSRALLNSTHYQLLSLNFYRLLGNTCWRLNRLSEAASAYAYGIAIAENSLRTLQMNTRERLQWVAKMDEVYRGMTRVRIEQRRAEEAWRLWEWYRTRSLMPGAVSAGAIPATESSWQKVEAEIAKIKFPSERHLVYASFEDGVEAWTVDISGIRTHWIQMPQTNLERLVNGFAEKCADRSSPLTDIHVEAQALYRLLLQPVVSDLPQSSTVVVELDRALSRLVLPALMTPEGKYFAESHTVVYSPGVLVEKNLRAPLPIEASDRLLLVDASEPRGAGAVPGHLEEREAALQAYSHVRLITGGQTSAAEIRRELSKSTVFDFIGHGEQRGSHTQLRLSAKSSLTPEDFPPSALAHIKLSILAACSTGAGGDDRLLDTDNLVHSFLSAGVTDVIASQWNVDSAATTQLFRNFYAHLGEGEGAVQSMYRAQKEVLAARNHPYYWAGFNLSGRAD